jgi:peptide chain release factor subunit 1
MSGHVVLTAAAPISNNHISCAPAPHALHFPLVGGCNQAIELAADALSKPPVHLHQVNVSSLHCVAGGENGFNQAIELAADMLSNVKFVQEKRLISKFFDEISQDTGKFVFSVKDTLACLEMGAVETLIVWEALDCDR